MVIFFSSLQLLSGLHHLSIHPTSCFFFSLFLKERKTKNEKNIEKSTHKNKQTKNTTIITYTMESVLCLLATPGHGACF